MSVVGGSIALTLSDWAKRIDPKGKVDKVVELFTQANEVLDDMMYVEGNLETGHKTTIRSGLPEATWRQLNYGVQPSKSTTTQVTDTCGMLEAYAEVDKALADLNGNSVDFRLSEDRAFLESMNQQMASTLIYGNTAVTPERFMGLTPRYNTMVVDNAASAANVLSGGGTGNTNTSIWLLSWSESTAHGIFPKGSKAGIQHNNLGQQTLYDNQTPPGRFEGYRTHYKWDIGFTLRDWRYTARICNIDVAALTKDAATGANLLDLMVQAIELLPNTALGRPVFYVNRTIRSFLRRQLMNKTNLHLTMEQVEGRHVVMFDGIPVKRCDQIVNTEPKVI